MSTSNEQDKPRSGSGGLPGGGAEPPGGSKQRVDIVFLTLGARPGEASGGRGEGLFP